MWPLLHKLHTFYLAFSMRPNVLIATCKFGSNCKVYRSLQERGVGKEFLILFCAHPSQSHQDFWGFFWVKQKKSRGMPTKGLLKFLPTSSIDSGHPWSAYEMWWRLQGSNIKVQPRDIQSNWCNAREQTQRKERIKIEHWTQTHRKGKVSCILVLNCKITRGHLH